MLNYRTFYYFLKDFSAIIIAQNSYKNGKGAARISKQLIQSKCLTNITDEVLNYVSEIPFELLLILTNEKHVLKKERKKERKKGFFRERFQEEMYILLKSHEHYNNIKSGRNA